MTPQLEQAVIEVVEHASRQEYNRQERERKQKREKWKTPLSPIVADTLGKITIAAVLSGEQFTLADIGEPPPSRQLPPGWQNAGTLGQLLSEEDFWALVGKICARFGSNGGHAAAARRQEIERQESRRTTDQPELY